MSSVNRVTLIGNIGRELELRQTNKGVPVTNFSLATTKLDVITGAKKDGAEWHRIVIYGERAKVAVAKFIKGDVVYVEGRLSTSKRYDEHQIEHFSTDVIVSDIKLMRKAFTPGSESLAYQGSDK